MSNQLTFQSIALTAISRNNQIYISASDLARALQYKCVKSVTNLFNANADEFTAEMSQVIESVTSGNYKKSVRIFSLRGCHLIAMFARTPVAKEFRKWVLDILDKEVQHQPKQPQLPVERSFTRDFINHEAVDMAWVWYEAFRMADFIKTITPALEAIHSSFAAEAHSMGVEYGNHLKYTAKLFHRLASEADFGRNPRPLNALNAVLNPKKQIAKF